MATEGDAIRVRGEESDERPTITAHESRTDRTVFTEADNKEGWIATDLTIERWL